MKTVHTFVAFRLLFISFNFTNTFVQDTNNLYVTKAKSDGLIHKPIVVMILRMIYDQDIHEF